MTRSRSELAISVVELTTGRVQLAKWNAHLSTAPAAQTTGTVFEWSGNDAEQSATVADCSAEGGERSGTTPDCSAAPAECSGSVAEYSGGVAEWSGTVTERSGSGDLAKSHDFLANPEKELAHLVNVRYNADKGKAWFAGVRVNSPRTLERTRGRSSNGNNQRIRVGG